MTSSNSSHDIFRQTRGEMREENEKRVKYVQHRDQRAIVPLWTAGRFVRSSLGDCQETDRYLRMVLDVNEAYFEARTFEDRIEGKFFKFDEDAERRVRERTADGYSDAVTNLRALVDAHDAALEAIETGEEFESRLLGATRNVLAGGWFPTLETYYHALDPGEKIAESVTRREARIEGGDQTAGVRNLLAGPLFESLDADDLDAIKEIDRRSPGKPVRFVTRLEQEFDFLIKRNRR